MTDERKNGSEGAYNLFLFLSKSNEREQLISGIHFSEEKKFLQDYWLKHYSGPVCNLKHLFPDPLKTASQKGNMTQHF